MTEFANQPHSSHTSSSSYSFFNDDDGDSDGASAHNTSSAASAAASAPSDSGTAFTLSTGALRGPPDMMSTSEGGSWKSGCGRSKGG